MNEPLISQTEAAAYLGIGKSTLWAYVGQRRIPFYRVGRRVLFRYSDLNGWLAGNRVEAER